MAVTAVDHDTLTEEHVDFQNGVDFKTAQDECVRWAPLLSPRFESTSGPSRIPLTPASKLLLSTPRNLTPSTPSCTSRRRDTELGSFAKSNTHPDLCTVSEMRALLRTNQAEMLSHLRAWMEEHQQNLEQTLHAFRESRRVSRAEPMSPKIKLRRSVTENSLHSNAKPKLRRSGSQTSVETNTTSVPSESLFEGRTSIQSFQSERSDQPQYISVQQLRDQCLQKSDSPTLTPMWHPPGSRSLSEQFTGWKIGSRIRCLVNNFYFELLFAILICINSVMLGVEVAYVSSSPTNDVPHFFYYSTMWFTTLFFIELIFRLVAEGGFLSFLIYSELRAWNWFDFLIVICSLVELGFNFVLLGGGSQSVTRIMRMARMTRLGRVLRIARIVRFVSQLRVLVISILSTLQTLLWALFLLLIIVYVFAVLLAQATAEHFSDSSPSFQRESLTGTERELEHYWGSLQAAMYTLFMSISGGVSWEVAVSAIARVHWIWGAFFTSFIAFSSFALINVMTAVFCQSAIESAQRNVDVKWQTMCADKRKHIITLKRLFKSLDGNAKGTISSRKLQRCWGDQAMQAFLNSMELEPDDCWTFFAILDKQDKEVNAHDFVEGCLRLKGYAKAFDIAVMTYELRHLSKQNVAFMNRMQQFMQEVTKAIGNPAASSVYHSFASESSEAFSP